MQICFHSATFGVFKYEQLAKRLYPFRVGLAGMLWTLVLLHNTSALELEVTDGRHSPAGFSVKEQN